MEIQDGRQFVSAGGGVVPMNAEQYSAGKGTVANPLGYTQEQAKQEGIYAVKIQGDSMYPPLRDGWYLYVRPEPTKMLKLGDLVIFRDDQDTAWVKEIESVTENEIVFRSIGKGPTIIEDRVHVKAVDRVFFIRPS